MNYRKQTGFSLIELFVSLSIVVIIALSATPSVNALMNTNTITITQAALIQDIRLVRSFARSHRTPAYLCAIDEQNECTNQANWSKGWLGYLDNNYSHHFDEGDQIVVQYAQGEPSNIDVLLHMMNKTIMVDTAGIIRSSGHFRICDRSVTEARMMTLIRMNAQGRLSLDKVNNVACR